MMGNSIEIKGKWNSPSKKAISSNKNDTGVLVRDKEDNMVQLDKEKDSVSIKDGAVFQFKTYDEAYNFLQDKTNVCEKGCILAIPGSATNTVKCNKIRGFANNV